MFIRVSVKQTDEKIALPIKNINRITMLYNTVTVYMNDKNSVDVKEDYCDLVERINEMGNK